jgi:thiamine pyrophosphate-dependent acetolactate synthase large subunit-like protein
VIKPQYVVEKLYEVTGGDAFVTSDVGQHQMWAAQYYKFNKPRRWINSGGLGTMGFGLPAAMGVQLAHPDAQVACITGEGSIQMNIQELVHLQGVEAAPQDHPAEQRLPGHGAAVAGVLLRRALRRVLHDFAAGLS